MMRCRCEGSCPECRLGEVENHQCKRCGRKFCSTCHGVSSGSAVNVEPCKCQKLTVNN